MAHYPTLTYSTFKVQASGLSAELRLPPELDTNLPPAYDFELEKKVVTDYEASQAAAEELAAAATAVSTSANKPNGSDQNSVTGGVAALSLDDPEKKDKMARMKDLTKADEKTCLFYLESSSWDLERACQEYFSK